MAEPVHGIGWTVWDYLLHDIERGRRPTVAELRRAWDDDCAAEIPPAVYDYIREQLGVTARGRPARPFDDLATFGRWPAHIATAYMDFVYLWPELLELEVSRPSDGRNLHTFESRCLFATDDPDDMTPLMVRVEMRYIESRNVWRANNPKDQARRIVANRHTISARAIERFEVAFNRDDSPLGEMF